MSDKARIIELQRSNKIAREALQKILHGTCDPIGLAEDALYRMMPLEKTQPLQGLLGHERKSDHV